MVDNKQGEGVIVKKENLKAEIIFNMKCPYNCQLLFASR